MSLTAMIRTHKDRDWQTNTKVLFPSAAAFWHMSLMDVSPMGLSCGEDDDYGNITSHEEVPYSTKEISRRQLRGGWGNMDVQYHQNDVEFGPVEHPMEPQDEDRPVRCPMPASSVINEGRVHERRSLDSMRKRAELPALMMSKEGTVVVSSETPVRAVRKRHHTLTYGDHHHVMTPPTRMPRPPAPPPPPPLPTQNITIFQMLQQLDQF